MVYTL